ncbi:MAG: hypothetical protein IKK83_01835 [Clostridia bacterium]|nr:hypothetical protein [Clostridia bacterium]
MSLHIEKIDKNFAASPELTKRFPTIKLYDATDCEAEICGLYHKGEDGVFGRLPLELSKINPSIEILSRYTAGGRIRFRTDSPFVAIRAKRLNTFYMRHMPLSGSTGCDIYVGRGKNSKFMKMCAPIRVEDEWFEDGCNVVHIGEEYTKELRDITVTLPLYGGISEIYIGIDECSSLVAPTPYTHGMVMFYGSSITQGGCACRSGTSYDGMISRMMDCDVYNLGFSGNAKGEPEIGEFIADLHPEVFVYDYDHNAPTVEHLAATHKPFYEIVRKKNPDMPIIFMSRPMGYSVGKEQTDARRQVIVKTYNEALAAGDKNVYFIGGETLFPEEWREFCTVDGSHPNDLGFSFMAKAVMKVLEKIYGDK